MTDNSVPIRAEIERLEQELMEQRRRLSALRKELPDALVDDHILHGPDGAHHLSDLFGEHADLIVIHNMGSDCRHCTMWADGFNGLLPYFRSRAVFVVVSCDRPEIQREFADSKGWNFPMYSDESGEFTRAMGFLREWQGKLGLWPGVSTFHRSPDGSIRRVAFANFGPHDEYCPVWNIFDLLHDGVGDWQPTLA